MNDPDILKTGKRAGRLPDQNAQIFSYEPGTDQIKEFETRKTIISET